MPPPQLTIQSVLATLTTKQQEETQLHRPSPLFEKARELAGSLEPDAPPPSAADQHKFDLPQ